MKELDFVISDGMPGREIKIQGATILHGIGVAKDGTIYVSNTRKPECIYKVTADGAVSTFVEGKPLAAPNGIAIDNVGNIMSVNIDDTAVLTFNPQGKLIRTENTVESGNDGIVILKDGTKYVSSGEWWCVADSSREKRRADRAQHSECGIDVLRRGGESIGDSDESNNGLAFVRLN